LDKKASKQRTVRDSFKALNKLRQEVQAAKELLSSSTGIDIQIESLYDNKDFKAFVTKNQFEEKCDELLRKAVAPIEQVMRQSNSQESEIAFIELFGGGVRVPKVQQVLQEKFKIPIGQHVNGEDGAAFGAALYLAHLKKWVDSPPEFVIQDLPPAEDTSALPPLAEAHVRAIERDLAKLAQAEKDYAESVRWRNSLESFVFEEKDALESNKKIPKSNKAALEELLAQTEEWMDEHDASIGAATFKKRYDELSTRVAALKANEKDEL